jgi:hypothetical protein
MNRTQTLAQIFATMKKIGLDPEERTHLAYQVSSGRTQSFRELDGHELEQIAQTLNARTKRAITPDSPAQRMRRKLISMAHEIGWQLPGGKADMPRINQWCEKYGHGHKQLNSYTAKELPTLITQFERGPYLYKLEKN